MSSTSNDASSSGNPKSSAERTAQIGGIGRTPDTTGINLSRDVSGFRICYICYDEEGERICNEIPCPSDVSGATESASPPAADASGIAVARAKTRTKAGSASQRTAQGGGIDRGPVLDLPTGGTGIERPPVATGLAEACYMCHEHNGEMVCHEITCP